MTTESAAAPNTSTPASTEPASGTPATPPAGGESAAGTPPSNPAQGDSLLFQDPPKDGEAPKEAPKPEEKPAQPGEKPTAEQMRAQLKELGVEDKDLEGKSEEDITKLHGEKMAAEQERQTFHLDKMQLPDGYIIPEGMKGEMGKLADVFADSKLTRDEKMQKAADMHVKAEQEKMEFWNQTKQHWRDQCKQDPEIGGEKLANVCKSTERLILKFGGTKEQIVEMQDDLVLLGLGNKPSFLRFMNNIAKATGEDKMTGSSGINKEAAKTTAQKMYPNMVSETAKA